MKLIFIALALCLLVGAPTRAQHQITAAEYYFDTDPGVGQGTYINIATTVDTLIIAQTLNLPLSLATGKHFVYLRTYADSAGYNGVWSMAARQGITVMPTISGAEYFIDTDPGVGQGIPLSISIGDTVIENLNITIPVNITSGQHYLYTRTKSSTGVWGLVKGQSFFVPSSVVAAEYFIDTDPGVGQGISLSLPSSDTVIENLNIPIPVGINSGRHNLYARTKSNSGKWSLVQNQSFFVPNSLIAAEYFIDTDPGLGQGISFSIPIRDSIMENLSITLPSTISSGIHYLYARTKDINGTWGLTQRISVYVKDQLTAVEYFFDTDPGPGNGIPWPNSISPSDSLNLIADIQLPCLSAGMHLLYFRSQVALGVWGMTNMDTFYINSPILTLGSEIPGSGPYGTPVRLHASGGEGPYLFSMNGGPYLTDSLFLADNGATVSFNVTDTCGNSGSVMVNTPLAPTQISTTDTSSINLLMNGWRYWVYLLDSKGDIVAAVKDNGQNLGMVTAGHWHHSGTVRQFPQSWGSKYYLDRNWVVKAQYAPLDSVGLRLYALNSEFNALSAADPAITDYNDLRIFKYDGPNEDLNFSNNNSALGGSVIKSDSLAPITFGLTAGYWLDFRIASFSEFYQSSESGFPLAIRSLDLKAIPSHGQVEIIWSVLGEQHLVNYTIQRSIDGVQWKPLGNLAAKNVAHAQYVFNDVQPKKGWSFYRLMIKDNQNKVSYSIVVRVNIKETRRIALYPNPVRDEINILGTKLADYISIQDANGREVWTSKAIDSQIKISVRGLASGVYLVRIIGSDCEVWTQKVEILK